MAIIIEEERPGRVGLIQLVSWIIILLLIGVVVYYVFFRKPPLVEITLPAGTENAEELLQLKLNPDSVTNSPVFNSLQEYVVFPPPSPVGRSNPFEPF